MYFLMSVVSCHWSVVIGKNIPPAPCSLLPAPCSPSLVQTTLGINLPPYCQIYPHPILIPLSFHLRCQTYHRHHFVVDFALSPLQI